MNICDIDLVVVVNEYLVVIIIGEGLLKFKKINIFLVTEWKFCKLLSTIDTSPVGLIM